MTNTGRPATAGREWVSRAEAARRLGIHTKMVGKVVEAGGVRVRELPGIAPRYHAGDLARLSAEAVKGPART